MGVLLHFADNMELKEKILLNVQEIESRVENTLNLPHIRLTQADRLVLLQQLKEKIRPLQIEYERITKIAQHSVQRLVWSVFFGLCAQFIVFARFTWWDSSWDVMEPVTYFTSVVETVIASYFYYMLTGDEYEHMGLRALLFRWRFRRFLQKYNFPQEKFDDIKAQIAALEHEIEQFADDATLK